MQILKSTDIVGDREVIAKEQMGICPICKEVLVNPCLDHSHSNKKGGTGQIRGVLCRKCNSWEGKLVNAATRVGLGAYDIVKLLKGLASYLERPHYPMLHPSEAPKKPKIGKRDFNKLNKLYKKKYPTRKPLVYPRSGNLTVKLKNLLKEFND